MRPAEEIKRLIENLSDKTSAQMDQQVRGDMMRALEESNQKSAPLELYIRKKIMKSSITKLAAAAVIILAVGFGFFEFLDTGNKSGVVWADVAKKVQASRGLICRRIMTLSDRPDEEDYRMIYCCPTHSRTDQYEANQVTWSRYCDYNTRTMVRIEHDSKRYFRHTISEQEAQEHRDETSPKVWAQKFLSAECQKLGQKIIDGILCEGLETTDQAVVGESDPPVDSVVLQLWVSVETGYPVLLEGSAVRAADGVRIEAVLDQLQWDIELDPSEFEPKIPSDYELAD